MRPLIAKYGEIVACDFSGQQDMSQTEADVAVVLGGDGSILHAAHQMGDRQLPVVAVNLGKLGFLADVAPDELPEVLGDLQAGKLAIVEHLMFDCQLLRRARGCAPPTRPERGDRAGRAALFRFSTSIFTLTQNW